VRAVFRSPQPPATLRPSGTVSGVRSALSRRQSRSACLVDSPIIAYVSGTAREKSRRTICDFFPKTESDFAALGRRGKFAPFYFGRASSLVERWPSRAL
jgi:hypothetical protein